MCAGAPTATTLNYAPDTVQDSVSDKINLAILKLEPFLLNLDRLGGIQKLRRQKGMVWWSIKCLCLSTRGKWVVKK